MNLEQLSEQALKHNSEIAALKESAKSAHKRIDENDRVTKGIYELASNIKALATEVKLLAERVDASIERIEAGLKSQGERIGALESEPGRKWKALVMRLISLTVAAAFGAFWAKFM